jgi:hypothetical protein
MTTAIGLRIGDSDEKAMAEKTKTRESSGRLASGDAR